MLSEHRSNVRRRALKAKRKPWALGLLGGKCVRCGTSERLEFDHIDRRSKSFDISNYLHSHTIDKLGEELSKCQLLCKPCHVSKTMEERGLRPSSHGDLSMYTNRGCRCDLCKHANTAHYRKKRAEARALKAS